jgi:hypothetical protein
MFSKTDSLLDLELESQISGKRRTGMKNRNKTGSKNSTRKEKENSNLVIRLARAELRRFWASARGDFHFRHQR